MKNKFLKVVEDAAFKKVAELAEKSETKRVIEPFQVGDTVEVHLRMLDGDKERIQVFTGMVISRRGHGMGEMFTVRRIVQGEGVERGFPLVSPKVAKVTVKKTGAVRRAKLYYMRDRSGKGTRLKERIVREAPAKAK
ncbi:MAG: 50S ribosomal protein L19 [Gemmataceae bacterium]|nr:50S ribosomal protein L19 [Gemmataceae bacterium]